MVNHSRFYDVKKVLGLILTIGILVLIDQWTKWMAINYLKEGSITLISGVFELYYVENTGAAFSLLQGHTSLLVVFTLVVLALLFAIYPRIRSGKHYFPLRFCCCLIGAGAIGNLIDRITRHFVVDFLYLSLIDFPIFNVADIYVTVGCALALICLLFVYREDDILC